MPLLPMRALRRLQGESDPQEDGRGRRTRVTRGVTLSAAGDDTMQTPQRGEKMIEEVASAMRTKSFSQAELAPHLPSHGTRPPVAAGDSITSRGMLRRPSAPPAIAAYSPQAVLASPSPRPAPAANSGGVMQPHHMWSPPAKGRVSFAPSPQKQAMEITPYAQVYGPHPAYFDFDRQGKMQPTTAGHTELRRGALSLTPSTKGRKALVIAGNASPSSSASPVSRTWPTSPAAPAACPFAVQEQVHVLTDDGQAWMDGQVVSLFPHDTEAEGYSIPAGTIKVSYELGIKWVMPQNLSTTLRKKAPSTTFMPAPLPRQSHAGVQQQQQQQQQQQGYAPNAWHQRSRTSMQSAFLRGRS